MKNLSPEDEVRRLRRKLGIYKIILAALICAVLFLPAPKYFLQLKTTLQRFVSARNNEKSLPHYDEVMAIIRPLRYSGLQALVRPEVNFDIHFDLKRWDIHNLHRFDTYGNLLLDEGRYGLCGELSTYVSHKIKPLFGDSYRIAYAKVSESGFFLAPNASHIVLLIQKKSLLTSATYLLDPSFQRYGIKDDFDDYYYFETLDTLPYINDRYSDVFFEIGRGTPILINHDSLINLEVKDSNGKFDKDNFIIALTATERFKYSGRYIIALRNNAGKAEIFENAALVAELFDSDDYSKLRRKLVNFFKQYNHDNTL